MFGQCRRKRERQAAFANPDDNENFSSTNVRDNDLFLIPNFKSFHDESSYSQDNRYQFKRNRTENNTTKETNTICHTNTSTRPLPNSFTRKHVDQTGMLGYGNQSVNQYNITSADEARPSNFQQIHQQHKRVNEMSIDGCLTTANKQTNLNRTANEKINSRKNNAKKIAPRFITCSIQDLETWYKITEKEEIMFELFGILNSTIQYHNSLPEKTFNIKDPTGNIRCVFWEIDRRINEIRRGSQIRCVGKLRDSYFHCLSVRNVSPGELRMVSQLQETCSSVQKELIAREEL